MGADGQQYFVTPDGQFFRHDGSPQSNLTGTFVAQLDADVYARPGLLVNAETHYLDVALDLHVRDDFLNDPLDHWLLDKTPTQRSQAMPHAGNVSSVHEQSYVHSERLIARVASAPLTGVAGKFALHLDGIESTYSHKSLGSSKDGSYRRDLATSESGQGLTDEIFEDWSRIVVSSAG